MVVTLNMLGTAANGQLVILNHKGACQTATQCLFAKCAFLTQGMLDVAQLRSRVISKWA